VWRLIGLPKSVANWLSSKGLQRSAIEPVGVGEANPVAPNTDARERAKNRRVEIFPTRS
jgi:outer membrane protein OmpA-like peptidoglycan-associated protein